MQSAAPEVGGGGEPRSYDARGGQGLAGLDVEGVQAAGLDR